MFQRLPVFLRTCKHLPPLPPREDPIEGVLQPVGQQAPASLDKRITSGQYVWSIKYDGIRVHLMSDGRVYTKSGHHIAWVRHPLQVGAEEVLDAEMIVRSYKTGVLRKTFRHVMDSLQRRKSSGFVFKVIDIVSLPNTPFEQRYRLLQKRFRSRVVMQRSVASMTELQRVVASSIANGHEGVVVRDKTALHSTKRDRRTMFKCKRPLEA